MYDMVVYNLGAVCMREWYGIDCGGAVFFCGDMMAKAL